MCVKSGNDNGGPNLFLHVPELKVARILQVTVEDERVGQSVQHLGLSLKGVGKHFFVGVLHPINILGHIKTVLEKTEINSQIVEE